MIILGIDPGIGRIGWALINEEKSKQKLIDYGCLETDSKLSPEERLKIIHTFFHDLMNKVKPDVVSIEQLFFATNAKTAFSVGQARGVIVLATSQIGIPLISYTPLQVKLTVCGYGKATKKQVQLMVKNLLNMTTIPKPDDAADAIAIALTHAYSYKLQNRLK